MATERKRTTGAETTRRTERTIVIPRKVAAEFSARLPKIISVCTTTNPYGTGDCFLSFWHWEPRRSAAAAAASRPVSSPHPRWSRDQHLGQQPRRTDGCLHILSSNRAARNAAAVQCGVFLFRYSSGGLNTQITRRETCSHMSM